MDLKNILKISQRDIDFFLYLHSVKVATKKQIGRDAYPDLSWEALKKRILRLEKTNHIQGNLSLTSGNRKAYSLTRNAFKKYVDTGDAKRKELKSDKIAHDLGLVEIRNVIKKSEFVRRYFPENTLQTWPIRYFGDYALPFVRLNSDALIQVEKEGARFDFAIEYERTLKYHLRYRNSLRDYYFEDSIVAVLFIVRKDRDIKYLQDLEKEVDKGGGAKFYYACFENLVGNGRLYFTNYKGREIQL